MECRAVRPLLSAYMDNEVTPDELRLVQEHVAGCADCAAILASYRQLRTAVRALPQPLPPPGLRAAVFARATPAYRRRALLFDFGQQAIAVGALVMTLLAVFFTARVVMSRGVGPATDPNAPPRIVEVVPSGGDALHWAPTRPIRITFSKPMDHAATEAAVLFDACPSGGSLTADDQADLRASMSWEEDKGRRHTLVIGRLKPDTDYCLGIDPARARDEGGQPLQPGAADRIALRTALLVSYQEQATATAVVTATLAAQASATPATSPTAAASAAHVTATPAATTSGTILPGPARPTTAGPVQPATSTAGELPPPNPTATPRSAPRPAQPTDPPPPPPAATATPVPSTPTAPATATPKLPYPVAGGFGTLYASSPTVRARLGLPAAAAAPIPAAAQQFERGLMYWRGDTRTIYVLFFEQPGVWFGFTDTWAEGSPPGGGAGPLAGQYIPKRGFGKVWRDNPDFATRLGYALTADEQSFPGGMAQSFDNGVMLTSPGRWIYVLYANGTYDRYADESK
jgi:hypothetical protein